MKETQEYKVMVVVTQTVYASTPEEAELLAEKGQLATAIYAEPVQLWGKTYNANTSYGEFKKMARWFVDYIVALTNQRKNYKKNSKLWKTFPDTAECVVRPFDN